MERVRALLKDRRRSQRGSVLSGVLIITAFIAIIAGALMTELSTNFLLSHALVARVDREATVNSAMELAMNQLETAPLYGGCPAAPAIPPLNGLNAAVTYVSCVPIVDPGRTSPATRLASSAPFTVDGVTGVAGGGVEYLVGDSGGKVYGVRVGQTSTNWLASVGAAVSAPPTIMPDRATVLVPIGGGVSVLDFNDSSPATPECSLPAGGNVTAQASSGATLQTTAFFGDSRGTVYAYSTASQSCGGGAQTQVPQPVVAGPVVFPGPMNNSDELFVVVSDSSGSQLVDLVYQSKKRTFLRERTSPLAYPSAVGLAVDGSNLPARIAITFAGGGVQVVTVNSGTMQSLGSTQLAAGLSDAPAWCCGSAPSTIAVGAQDGTLSVLNAASMVTASYQLGGAITGSPMADAGGDWFVGADDGNLYEIPASGSSGQVVSFGGGSLGLVRSSVEVVPCASSICAYLGSGPSGTGALYEVQLDTRQVAAWACIGTAVNSCSGANPRLWATMLVGSQSSPQAVAIQGWSYYSP